MKNKNQKRISVLLVAFLLFTGFRIFNKYSKSDDNKSSNDSSLTVDKVESNLRIKYLKTGTDEQGKEYVSFNYEVLPAEANDKTVSLNLSWSDNSVTDNINSHLTYTHTQEEYFVKVTMLAKANHQAKMTLTSNANNNAKASILIDFEQEFLGFEPRGFGMLSKTLAGSPGESFVSDLEIQNSILSGSNGFLGTVSIHDKEISNFSKSFVKASANTNWPFKMIFDGTNENFNDAYDEIRSTSNTTSEFIAKLSTYFKDNLTDTQKEQVRNGDKLIIDATYDVTFDYYGETYTFSRTEKYQIDVTIFEDATYVDVSSIITEGNIIFK